MEARRQIIRTAALATAAFAAVGCAGAMFAVPANASVAPLQVTLTHSPDGSATCSSSGDIVLTTGSNESTTFAEADVNGVAGTALSATTGPSFVTNNYASGSPRWVIELNNGNSLWGYPPNSGLNGTDFAWAVNNGNTYTSYATAYASADASSTTIKDALIIADGDQLSTTDTISDATLNGQPLSCVTVSTSPSPTPSSSKSPTPTVPVGGVQTGGGKPATSPWLPFGIVLAVIGLFVGGIAAARRRVGRQL